MRRRSTRQRSEQARLSTLGPEQRDRLARRQAAVTRLVGAQSAEAARIVAAPAGYVLAHGSSDLARHGALLATLPAAGQARAVVTPA